MQYITADAFVPAQVSVIAISGFNCQWVGDPSGQKLLAADWRESCPTQDKGGFIFIWSVIFTILYPVGLPCGLILMLETYNVPSLAADKINTAKLKVK